MIIVVAQKGEPMNDLISREAAIDAMDGFNACGYVEEPFERLEKALKEIPAAQPEPRWIPCSERLPEANGNYLVTGRQGAVNKRKFEDGRWYGNWAVTAWMPLPKPYGGDEE